MFIFLEEGKVLTNKSRSEFLLLFYEIEANAGFVWKIVSCAWGASTGRMANKIFCNDIWLFINVCVIYIIHSQSSNDICFFSVGIQPRPRPLFSPVYVQNIVIYPIEPSS